MSPSMHLLRPPLLKSPLVTGARAFRLHVPIAAIPRVAERCYQTAAAVQDELDVPEHQDGHPQKRPFQVSKRYPDTLDPPTHSLKRRLQSRDAELSLKRLEQSREFAKLRWPRFAILAYQLLLREDERRLQTSVSDFLSEAGWRARLEMLASKGLQESDLAHYIWILEPESSDDKVDRLVATDRFKPVFVLMAILRRSDEHFMKGSSLIKLYEYIAKNFCESRTSPLSQVPQSTGARARDNFLNMTPANFKRMLNRLVFHCLRTFPSSVVMVARLVVRYIQTMMDDSPPRRPDQRTAYANRCMIFNHALNIFRLTPHASPVAHTQHAWKAQRILLEFSAGLRRPLVIDEQSYRAIRMVLTGLKKSKEEDMTAARHVKTWPPHIKHLDGVDEARDHEEYLSRNVKAGMLKRSEGYPDDPIDRALDVIGGAIPGKSLTIQQRSAPLPTWHANFQSLNVFTVWASVVKSTRNAQEAWERFHEPPRPGLKPNFQVYAEMFSKLFAAEVDYASHLLPGDGKEVYPVHHSNLTEFEQQRLRPCSADDLYERMLRDGNRPVRHLLSLLVRNAPDMDRAAQFLSDSGLDKNAVNDLTTTVQPFYKNLVLIPEGVFDAYLFLLCRLQPRQRWVYDPKHRPQPNVVAKYERVGRAIKLLGSRTGPGRKPMARPWYTVMRYLANGKLVLRPYNTQLADDLDALQTMLHLFQGYNRFHEQHPIPFDCLGRCVLKVLRHQTSSEDDLRSPEHVDTAIKSLKPAFTQLISQCRFAASDPDLDAEPSSYHDMSAAHIQTYLEVLAKVGAVDEGVRVVEWVLSSWSTRHALRNARDPEHKQWTMLMQAFTCFRALADEHADKTTLERIEGRFQELAQRGGTWRWPTEEDVEEYRRYFDERNETMSIWS